MFPTFERWPENPVRIAQQFFNIAGFPSVCECVDGTLVNIDAPTENETAYVDRHVYHSLNCMMVCGPNFQVYVVNANWPGSVHDARVLRNSATARDFGQGFRPFPNAVILGDSAYGLKEWLMVPLRRNPNDIAEHNYNRRHKSARRVIENAYGILKERFPCLNHLRVSPRRARIAAKVYFMNLTMNVSITSVMVTTKSYSNRK
ncbi:putative nuclease HARBI1 [Diorhabda carinulata]|uniref:putative nuclease HARBI1 n=1 Tax=Diorhabda carinulata TaxID=1163345 RepID=UPI0025A00C16|nr:putative nuclease HARBI1 [Diorhabda carinulata]